MKCNWHASLGALILCMGPVHAWADPPARGEPTNHGVLLPPQLFDEPVKTPNNTRERRGEWSISGGVYFIQPVFNTNPAFVVNGPGANISRQVDFSHHLDVAPGVWIGYVSERGWGVRGRWMQFDHSNDTGYSSAPGEAIVGLSPLALGRVPLNGTIAASNNLAVNVFDVEGTCSYDSAFWTHLLGFGVRYAHMSQDYRATLFNPANQIVLWSGHNINGAGPCFSLETKRHLRESGFSIYGQMHGAIVVGRAKEAYTVLNNGVPGQFTRSSTDVLPIGELEVGAEYQRNVGRAKLFVQTGFVGQVWWGGGNASNLDPIGPSSASNSNFGFLGLALRAGVRY